MSLLELRKRFLAVLLVSFMALGMAACSSTGDSDDAAADESASAGAGEVPPTQEGVDCEELYDTQKLIDNCLMAQEVID